MGSFLRRGGEPRAVVVIELPPALPPGCAYALKITGLASEDRVTRIVRDGLEIVAVHPDGRVEVHPEILSLCEGMESGSEP